VPYGDPENPLGSHWVGWLDENGRPTDVGFHGTSDESGVGGEVSLGCLRMRNADVEVLHDVVPQGSEVHVQP
jgi:lipoprotein-anchoring transpeptidase ErfK/SrfK